MNLQIEMGHHVYSMGYKIYQVSLVYCRPNKVLVGNNKLNNEDLPYEV